MQIYKGCGSINCAIWSKLHKQQKFLGKCNGTAAKFGNLENFANEFIQKKAIREHTKPSKKDEANATTTNQKPNIFQWEHVKDLLISH